MLYAIQLYCLSVEKIALTYSPRKQCSLSTYSPEKEDAIFTYSTRKQCAIFTYSARKRGTAFTYSPIKTRCSITHALTSKLGCDVQVVDSEAGHGEAPSTHPQRQQHDGQRVVAACVARGNQQTGRKYGPCCHGNRVTVNTGVVATDLQI